MSNEALAVISMVATVVVTIANVFLVVLTRRYVRLTGGMLEHMRQSQSASVVLDMTFDGRSAHLLVANTGQTAATNVKFEHVTGMEWSRHGNVQALSERGISYLPPGRTMRFWLGYPDWKQIEKEHPVVRIDLEYSADGATQRRDFLIDMSQYLGTSAESNPEDRIVNAIEELARAESRGGGVDAYVRAFIDPKKRCVECAEKIPTAAKRCSHCGELQNATASESASDESAQKAPPNST